VHLGIRFKLSLLTCLLIPTVIIVSAAIFLGILNSFLLGETVKRGLSLARGAAGAAGYSMLVRDRLSLDNLVAKIKERQEDIIYVAVIDHRGTVAAHSELLKNGSIFNPETGVALKKETDGAMALRVTRDGQDSYEFRTPIMFAGKVVGLFSLGIDDSSLTLAREAARRKVAFLAVVILLLSMAGTCSIASIFTRPIKRLSDRVLLLKSGSHPGPIAVTQHDELGELTSNFNQMASVIVNQKEKLAEYASGLEESYFATLKILATSIDARDGYTMEHSTRVAALSLLVADEMGLSPEEQRELEVAALVHDLGKIRIPDNILKKSAPLEDIEFNRVKHHPRDGADILGHSEALHRHIPAVLHHHEWHNGQGYPDGLKGEAIPRFAAIISLADAYDAMTTSRPYRAGLTAEYAIAEIIRYRGIQFDPRLTDCFVAAMRRRNLVIPDITVLETPIFNAPFLGATA